MDKNAIKKYAVWARRELLARVQQKALQYGISETETGEPGAEQVNGRLLSAREIEQRGELIRKIRRDGFEQAMEEAAYTWFNRFCALRYMEVNGVLPSHVRVFTDEAGAFKPQILTEAIHLELDGLDRNEVYRLKEADRTEELYKYLLITQCNALGAVLPGMFTRIEDYTELLFPENLLREGSVAEQLVSAIPEEDWTDQVQIIGWLYQYYNTEPKDRVFANLKKNIKIGKNDIPAATQLFTPDWIVRYMVENSLGRLWIEGHPDDDLKANWKYYLEEAQQEPEVEAQLAEIRKEYAALEPKDIKVIDPCMGSGHILVYLFDVLMQIYLSRGYNARDAVRSILENNLHGVDIDPRAYQLAYFSVMMKAMQYDRRFLDRHISPNLCHTQKVRLMFVQNLPKNDSIVTMLDDCKLAEQMGSLLIPGGYSVDALKEFYHSSGVDEIIGQYGIYEEENLKAVLEIARRNNILAQKYHVVVTNPPYMGSSNMNAQLSEFVKKYYPDSKADLYAVFMERCLKMADKNAFVAMITQHSWMFLSSFEKLRAKLQLVDTVNMAHLGPRAFEEIGGEVVQTTSFVMRKSHIADFSGTYCRLIEPTTQQGKEDMFLAGENRFSSKQGNFAKIPGAPVAYWASSAVYEAYQGNMLGNCADVRHGLSTGKNETFVRLWPEVPWPKIMVGCISREQAEKSGAKYFPYNKGGEYRKWYGNADCVVWYDKNGQEKMKALSGHRHDGRERYFQESITWSFISSSNFGVRYTPPGFVFDVAGSSMFAEHNMLFYIVGLLCSKLGQYFMSLQNPTLNFQVGNLRNVPLIIKNDDLVRSRVNNCIEAEKADWDSFETSWDFQRHPLIRNKAYVALWGDHPPEDHIDSASVELSFTRWSQECESRFQALKRNEEELNRIFIDIYGLQDELTPEVEEKDVTVRRADLKRDIRSLISYAVGCMFGRYSIYEEGLVFAGGEWDYDHYEAAAKQAKAAEEPLDLYSAETFLPNRDNIIPITDDEYFADDIVARFVRFIETVYGKYTLEENLNYIASALGGSGSAREVIRNYFLNDFFKDHLKTYQKRPIYWLFDSGKKNAFKCLVYMHRYQPDTLARIRTDYVHEQQSRYNTAIADLEQRAAGAATAERVKLTKQLTKLREQDAELRAYEEKIHHLADRMIAIDLDDGVKHNYEMFHDVLATIK